MGYIAGVILLLFLIIFLWASKKYKKMNRKPLDRYDHVTVMDKSIHEDSITNPDENEITVIKTYFVEFKVDGFPVLLEVKQEAYEHIEVGQIGLLFMKEKTFVDFAPEA